MMLMLDDLWTGFRESPAYVEIQQMLEHSYTWDNLIEFCISDLLTEGFINLYDGEVTDNDLAIACLAQEPRRNRAALAEALLEFLFQHGATRSKARVVLGRRGHAYVFIDGPSSDRQARSHELAIRCQIVGAKVPGVHTVVGIGTDRPNTSTVGYSSDIVYYHQPEWTQDDAALADASIHEFGFFRSVQWPARGAVEERWA